MYVATADVKSLKNKGVFQLLLILHDETYGRFLKVWRLDPTPQHPGLLLAAGPPTICKGFKLS